MIFLDTHVIVWLHEEDFGKFSSEILKKIEENELYYSPMVKVELHYLYGKVIRKPAREVIRTLEDAIGLMPSPYLFNDVAERALKIDWTRDPFDLLISAEVLDMPQDMLITRNRAIIENMQNAKW